MRLDKYTLGNYTPGLPYLQQLLCYFLGSPLVESYFLQISSVKIWILRFFGANLGKGVRNKTVSENQLPVAVKYRQLCLDW